MKRFTLILSLLVAMVTTAMAQTAISVSDFSTGDVYRIYNQKSGETVKAFALNDAQTQGWLRDYDETSAEQEWRLIEQDGKYLFLNLSTGKYLQDVGGASGVNVTSDINSAVAYTMETSGDDFFTFYHGDNADEPRHRLYNDGSGKLAGWKNDAGDHLFHMSYVRTLFQEVELTYIFVYEGETLYTETVTGLVGENYPTFTLPFGFSASALDGTVAADDTEKTIELTATFSWADSYENITAWYYLDLKDGKYLFYEEGQENIPLTKTAVDSNNKDAYTWGFIGDPVNGFQIVNYAAGESMILSSSTTMAGAEGGGTYPVMTATTSVPEGNNTHWVFTASTHRTGGFYIGQKGYASNRLNNRDNKLAYWTGGADAGSTFIMTERPMGPTAELEALIAEVEAMNIVAGTNIGDYTEASVNALNDAIAAAKAVETATADDVAALQAALDGLRVVLPDPTKFYYFDCTYEGRKLYINANNQLNWTDNTYDITNSRAIFQFEAGTAPNTVKIKSVHTQSYMGAISGNITFGETGADITIARSNSNEVAEDKKAYAVMFTTDGSTGIHANSNPVIAYTNGAGSNHYVLTEVADFKHTLTVTEAGWATLVLGFNATIPAEVTAYTIASEETGYVTLAEATGVLKANVPVLVEATAGSYEFAYTTAAATVTESGLEGTLYNKDITANAYVLGYINEEDEEAKVGFGLATTEGKTEGTFTNNANKAYFVPTNAQANVVSYSFRFGEGTTGVEEITDNREQSTVIYDLTGRRVEAITAPGIYIVNGVKRVIR